MAMDSDFSGSPTLFYPAPHHHFEQFTDNQSFQSPLSHWGLSSSNVDTVTKPVRPSITSNPSRKRSRDVFTEDELAVAAQVETNGLASMEVIEEPIYGPGMTLLNPSSGRTISAESQSGTWIEEKHEEEQVAAEKAAEELAESRRPILRPTKSCRLASVSSASQGDILITPASMASPVAEIDPASAMLGVGWKVMPREDEDMMQAVRGWARYIENHYPLNAVEIILKSEGQEAFVVRSQEGWWLFKEDLSEGRLVSPTWEGCVTGLRAEPKVFEGASTICAQRTPSPIAEEPAALANSEIQTGMDLD